MSIWQETTAVENLRNLLLSDDEPSLTLAINAINANLHPNHRGLHPNIAHLVMMFFVFYEDNHIKKSFKKIIKKNVSKTDWDKIVILDEILHNQYHNTK